MIPSQAGSSGASVSLPSIVYSGMDKFNAPTSAQGI